MGTKGLSPMIKPSEAIGALIPPLLQLSQSPSQGIPCMQTQPPTSCSRSQFPQSVKLVKRSSRGEGHYGPEGTDGPGPGAAATEADFCRFNRGSASPCLPKGVQNDMESLARIAEEEDTLSIVASGTRTPSPLKWRKERNLRSLPRQSPAQRLPRKLVRIRFQAPCRP
ncbi:UNVERIFIED_CONTAM: hypothetical protein FKN15_044654 [Acipenser sinensis]